MFLHLSSFIPNKSVPRRLIGAKSLKKCFDGSSWIFSGCLSNFRMAFGMAWIRTRAVEEAKSSSWFMTHLIMNKGFVRV